MPSRRSLADGRSTSRAFRRRTARLRSTIGRRRRLGVGLSGFLLFFFQFILKLVNPLDVIVVK
jgi:hypothetical protein